jgi:hypothetical protein
MRSWASSSWDNPGGGFKFAETKAPWLKPMRAAGADGIQQSSQQLWNNITPHEHHDFDGFIAFKGTSAKVLNQGSFSSVLQIDTILICKGFSRARNIFFSIKLLAVKTEKSKIVILVQFTHWMIIIIS